MIRVHTGSRLHFGILSISAESGRQFGGVGLMVQAPGVRVAVRPAAAWSAEGPLAARVLEFAKRFSQGFPKLTPHHLTVEQCAPEHAGLGTGTQLALAVARALAVAAGTEGLDTVELARLVGRGQRSALGIHGFAQGGFLVEAGKCRADAISPLAVRVAFPEEWRVVLAMPPWGEGVHGVEESQAFKQLPAQPLERTDALCRLVLLGMLPALAERDVGAFGEALYEFNRLVGEAFAPVQGGTYSCPRLEELVHYLRRQGIRGVAQSSWGPTIAAVVADEERAADLARRLRQHFGLDEGQVCITAAANTGAQVATIAEPSP